jgi:hypothetical protein
MEIKVLDLTVQVTGRTAGDIEAALHEVLRSVENGNISGADRNEDGDYTFEISGVDEDERSLMSPGDRDHG